jgi:5-methylcytosine-specific restriction endonuclease McrA
MERGVPPMHGSTIRSPVELLAASSTQPTLHPSTTLVLIVVALGAIGLVARSLERRRRGQRRAARIERQRQYSRYLRSEGWRERRDAAIARADGRCQDCGARRALDVHHLTYRRKGAELPQDLRALCRQCHRARHRRTRSTLHWIALSILRWFRTRRDRSPGPGVDSI